MTKIVDAEKKSRKRSSLLEDKLISGEKVVQEAHIHLGIYWKSFAVLIIAVLVGLFVAQQLGILLLVVFILMAGYAAAMRAILMLVLTDKRVLVRYGILQMDVVDIHFDKIESVELERMPPGMIMGYANVVILGTGNRQIVIPYVSNGPQIRRSYNEMVLNKK